MTDVITSNTTQENLNFDSTTSSELSPVLIHYNEKINKQALNEASNSALLQHNIDLELTLEKALNNEVDIVPSKFTTVIDSPNITKTVKLKTAPNKMTSFINENGALLNHYNINSDDIDIDDDDDLNESLISPLIKDGEDEIKHIKPVVPYVDESMLKIGLEVFFPYLIGGMGMVAAGYVLNNVQHWSVFVNVSEVFILVPALLGLKGNLEMTLASRLSTQANLGNMDTRREKLLMIGGNLALTQAQAIIVGLLASIFAMMLGWIPIGKFEIMHGFLLCSASVVTAALASLILGLIMIGVVLLSRRFHINPDNVATPIAASLGDLTTISLLACIAQFLFNSLNTHLWLTPLVLGIMCCMIPLWWYVAHKNIYTPAVLYSGWVPVIGAMIISSLGGLVLDYTVANYEGVAVFQPVINGVGGNLVAVQASRLSTALHRVSTPGHLPENAVHGCPNPIKTFFGKSIGSRTARVLLLMVVPGQLVFILVIFLLQQSNSVHISPLFVAIYLIAAIIQVLLLLYIANGLVHFLWWRGTDPDNSAIPYLTAFGDLLGTTLLALAFLILSKIQPKLPL